MRVLALLLFPALLMAQSGRTSAVAGNGVPRMGGKPDLTGVWQGGSTIAGSWEEANRGFGVGGSGKDANAPALPSSNDRVGNGPPYNPEAAKKVLESYRIRGIDDPTGRCLPPGIPRANTLGLFPIQIVQTPRQVVILYEYMTIFRVIPLNAKHRDDVEPTYMGDSVGHWEGDTLVVDVTNFNDKTWLGGGTGNFHSEAMRITEKYTRIGKDRINYTAIIEDPKVFTKPWVVESSMMLREGTHLGEYVCVENNLDPGRYEEMIKNGVKFTRP